MDKFKFVNKEFERLGGSRKYKEFSFERIDTRQTVFLGKKQLVLIAAIIIFGLGMYFSKGLIVQLMKGDSADVAVKTDGVQSSHGKRPVKVNKAGLSPDFKPEVLKTGSKAVYNFDIQMPKENVFNVKAKIGLTNTSSLNWNEILLYFYLNRMGTNARLKCYSKGGLAFEACLKKVGGGEVKVESVQYNGEPVKYFLEEDRLRLYPSSTLNKGKTGNIEIKYTFSLPGMYQENGSYNLPQWYPLVPDFDGSWNLLPYFEQKDTYTSAEAEYTIHYQLFKDFNIVSSGSDPATKAAAGTIKANALNEWYLMLLDGFVQEEAKVNDMTIRVHFEQGKQSDGEHALKAAAEAVSFFEEKLGPYPYKQLDIVLTKANRGSYPGLILVPENRREGMSMFARIEETLEHAVVVQTAQQWFYGKVLFDRYRDLWLQYGLSELAASLYFLDGKQLTEEESFQYTLEYLNVLKGWESGKANLPPEQYYSTTSGLIVHTQLKPAYRLWELMKPHSQNDRWNFLSGYLKTYSGKKIATIEFIRFAKNYFKVNDESFDDWLNYNPYRDEFIEMKL
ncbi:hypothetical protein A8F94_12620 [Bacillus sp. FJAT-27225]|uniref:hypothetical protein n=1 Tax=Bacillus sp. FJAT-27225 TaxID=1743144 RepID=UPI00080C2D99|nr:hypothetical protein [Bacillus sp. FJAT-27225]OCA85712.1 hypothetical protein A8F94_12620 [Bacillus sp. FJAT-27225]